MRSPRAEVGGGQDLAEVEGARVGPAAVAEVVHDVADVVRHHEKEAVDVGQELGEEEVLHGRCVHGGPGAPVRVEGQQGAGKRKKWMSRYGPTTTERNSQPE